MIEAYFDLLDGLAGYTISEKTKNALYAMTVTILDHEAGQVFETLCHDDKTGFVLHNDIVNLMLTEIKTMVNRIILPQS